MDPVFTGVGVALVTLFDDHRTLDADATAGLAAQLVELGADAIVVAGTTGEADALDDDERLRLFSAVRDAVGDAVVVGGTGAASTHQAVALTARAPDTGVDAVIARTPRGLADPSGYYRELADAAGATPVLAYHFPAVSPPGIPVEVLPGLPVAGCKDSSGDPTRLLATVDSYAGPVWTGNPALIHMAGRPRLRGRHPRPGQRRPRALRRRVRRRRRRDAQVHPDPPRLRARLPARGQAARRGAVRDLGGAADGVRAGPVVWSPVVSPAWAHRPPRTPGAGGRSRRPRGGRASPPPPPRGRGRGPPA